MMIWLVAYAVVAVATMGMVYAMWLNRERREIGTIVACFIGGAVWPLTLILLGLEMWEEDFLLAWLFLVFAVVIGCVLYALVTH